ncbi:cd7 antigen-like isoform X2 [Denticeps clupeoides]|uniref:cd7 antigen-like isoform X2 n=1 Tax=Denticeps clupeoides TaxID=299321 RepID=UPI0010A54F8D|nr:uncharacterized protein LOC114786345 isoform X2 [Denticeps clupeoides]
MTIKLFLFCFMILSPDVLGDVVYFSRQRDDSIYLPCVPEEHHALGFYLKYEWMTSKKDLLFLLYGQRPHIFDPIYKNRIIVPEDPKSQHNVTVTISHLDGSDTGMYLCVFVYEGVPSDRQVLSRTKFLLYVEDELAGCSCSSYPPLLLGAFGGKTRSERRAQPPIPIYEEMSGLRTESKKVMETNQYSPAHMENHYSNQWCSTCPAP